MGATLAVHGDFSLIVLDIGLPDIDGFEVLERIRGQGVATPGHHADRPVLGDRPGGRAGERRRRLHAQTLLLRGAAGPDPAAAAGRTGRARRRTVVSDAPWNIAELVLDYRTRRVQVDGQWIDLSAREFTLAEVFLRNPGQVLSREQLLSNVWGFDFDPGSNVVDVYVSYLRNKLGKERFETVRGMGYRLV